MSGIIEQSTVYGLLISAFCLLIAVSLRSYLAHINALAEFSAPVFGRIGLIFDYTIIVTMVPAMALHPALVTVYLYSLGDLSPMVPNYLAGLDQSEAGIICLGTFVHLPYAYLYIRSCLPLEDFVSTWHKAKMHYLPSAASYLSFVTLPVLLKLIPFFIILSVLIEGMIFIPYLNMTTSDNTIGRGLYDAVTTYKIAPTTAGVLLAVLLLKILFAVILGYVIAKKEARWKEKGALVLFKVLPHRRSRSGRLFTTDFGFSSKGGSLFMSTLPIFLVSLCLLVMLCLIVLADAALIATLWKHIGQGITDQGLVVLWNSITEAVQDIPLIFAVYNTAKVAFFGAILGVLIVLLASIWAGRRDYWVSHKTSHNLWLTSAIFVAVPPALYGYLFRDQLRSYPVLFLTLIFGWIGACAGLLTLGEGVQHALYKLERIRKSFSLDGFRYWKNSAFLIRNRIIMMALWIYLLLWNDTSLQLFSKPAFNGLPTHIIAAGHHGLSSEIASALAILQAALLFVTVPVCLYVFTRQQLTTSIKGA